MRIPAFIGALLLAACASKPAPPAWQPNAKDALDGFTDDYLRGNTAAANAEYARARRETTSTGRADLVAQVELVRCGVLAAALEFDDCPGFSALAPDATAQQRAYAAYLAGRWEGLDLGALPEQHRAVVGSGSIAGVVDPLSKLVAAGALFKAGRITPGDIEMAAETASSQGWRRPLLMWLGVAQKRAEAGGDGAAVERIKRRIALASGQK
ncbi:hypothetical protein [Massilia sp. Leaf139]|uniref:hypothetical protein n=1 Tax=Massilia sp. Leaf139 TaxID=1736272 RepID=UPI0007012FA9|nr:hypothetical protein [Massilia sp. Leaf139]KQQ97051.1 hypothetical protein ASF77_03545 [Massilia sp. Leaf139]